MIDRVYEILRPLKLPIEWQTRPKFNNKSIVVSYHFFNESNLLYGDGDEIEQGGSLQVDVFSNIDYSTTERDVKQLLKENGFKFYSGEDSIENIDNNTIIYHKTLIFNYIESEVMTYGQ